MIVATAGHVDHGKTSLVQLLTGVDTDRLKEEKQRGLTIDLGFAYTDTETGGRLGFVDVPGHIRFINNMLAGVSAIDLALLVVAADDGVMPQTVEHLDVLQLLGIQRGIIAVTKIDRVEAHRVDEVIGELEVLTASTFLAGADVYPVSSLSGEGVDTLKLALDIAAEETARRAADGLFRLAIDRRFSVHGSGIVVTGSVFAGNVSIGDNLILMPQGTPVRVRGLHTQNQSAESATAGDRCAVNLTGNRLELEDIHRGDWLTDNPAPASDRFDARLSVLASESHPLRHWTPIHLHTGANHVTGRVAVLAHKRIQPGTAALIQLVLDEAISVCTGDRFVIRDQSALRTIGGGEVLDPWSPKRGRARPERLDGLRQITPGSPSETLAGITEQSSSGVDTIRFSRMFNLTVDQMDQTIDETGALRLEDGWIVSQVHLDDAVETLRGKLDTWHEENPGKPGLPLNQIAAMMRQLPAPLLDRAIDTLLKTEDLQQHGNLLNRPGQGVQLNEREIATLGRIMPLLEEDPTKPPVLHDLAKSVGQDAKALEKVLNQVVKTGQLVKPVKNRFFLPSAIEQLKACLYEAADDNGQFTVQQYRDAAGTGRNLAIEMLEYFDRQGLTRRIGDSRQIME